MSGAEAVLRLSQQIKQLCMLGVVLGFSHSAAVYAAEPGTVPIVGPDGVGKVVTTPAQAKTYGPVKQSDTLWRIATNLRPEPSVSVHQTMLALYLKNPQAFENANINGLMRNALLMVPTLAEINAVTDAQALAKLAADSSPRKQVKPQSKPKSAPQPPVATEKQPPSPINIQEKTAAAPKVEAAPEPTPAPAKAEPASQPKQRLAENVQITVLQSELEDSMASMEDILDTNEQMAQQLVALEDTVQKLRVQLKEQMQSNQVATENLKEQVATNASDIEDSDSTSNLAFYLATVVGGIVLIITGLVVWLMLKSRKLAAEPAAATEAPAVAAAPELAATAVDEPAAPSADGSDAEALAALDELSALDGNDDLQDSLELNGGFEEDSSLLDLGESLEDDVIHLDDLDSDDSAGLDNDLAAVTTDDALIEQNDLAQDEGGLDIDALLNETAAAEPEPAEEPAAEEFDPDAILSNSDLDALLNDIGVEEEPEPAPEPEPTPEPEQTVAEEPAAAEPAVAETPAEPDNALDEALAALEQPAAAEQPQPAASDDAEALSLDDIDLDGLADINLDADEPLAEMAETTESSDNTLPDIESLSAELDADAGATENSDLAVDFDSLLNEDLTDQITNDGLEAPLSSESDSNYIDIDQLLMEAESAEPEVDEFPGLEPHSNAGNNEPEDGIAAKLDLARAYIEIGDFSVASDLLKEILQDGSDAQQAEASELLGRIDS